MSYVISANRLLSGSIVFLATDERWSEQFEDARIFSSDELEDAHQIGQRAENCNFVVGSYAVELKAGTPAVPKRLKDSIRRTGPTVGDHNPRTLGGPEG